MAAYTGLYTQHLSNGAVHGVQVRDTAGNDLSIDPQTYVQRGVQPPIDHLPSEDEYFKRRGVGNRAMEVIQLFAPNEQPIVGVVAADGSVRTFMYSYDHGSKVRLYVLDDGTELPSGPVVLLDAAGSRWDSSEVEWYTLFKRP